MQNIDKIIDPFFMNQAETILDVDDNHLSKEETSRKQIIIAICLKFKFKFKFFNDVVLIDSVLDEWYFNFSGDSISLFHKNKLQDTSDFHHQKKFKNIVYALQYIKKHDKFFYVPNKNHKYDMVNKVMDKNK